MEAIAAVVQSLRELLRVDAPYLEDTLLPTDPLVLLPPPPPPPRPLPHTPCSICPQPVVTSFQAAPISQGQRLQHQWPANIPAATRDLAAPPHPHVNLPVVWVTEGMKLTLCPVIYLNGHMANTIRPVASSPLLAAANQLSSSTPKKRRRNQHEDRRPYVKKPPNAFMLFMKEQRPILAAEMNHLDSRVIASLLGEQWKAMSSAKQDKYFQESYRLKRLYNQQDPDCVPNISKKP